MSKAKKIGKFLWKHKKKTAIAGGTAVATGTAFGFGVSAGLKEYFNKSKF